MPSSSHPALAALLVTAALLGACGGDLSNRAVPSAAAAPSPTDGGVSPGPAPATAPDAPSEFRLTAARGLHFHWAAATGASEYRLLEDPDGASGYTPVATLPAGATQHDLAALLPLKILAHYVLQACNPVGCTDSPALAVPDSLARAVDYLKASNTDTGDLFGSQLVLSARGDTLAVAASAEASTASGVNGNQADNGSSASGAVYVFTRSSDGAWRQQAYLKASNPDLSARFGSSLAISADGNTLAVGANQESSAAIGIDGDQASGQQILSGAVYVFTRSGEAWRQQAYLKASHSNPRARFGSSLALSAQGDTLAAGAPGESSSATGVNGDQANSTSPDSGAVYVFTRQGGWQQQAYLKASNTGPLDAFGRSVALSGDGDTLAVGAAGEDSAASGVNGEQSDNQRTASGAAYVFTRAAGSWQQQAYLKAAQPGELDGFGIGLALSGDGHTLAVAAPYESSAATGVDGPQDNDSASRSGAVYMFSRQDGLWAQQAYLKAFNTNAGDNFGAGIALSADGRVLAVGAPLEDSSASGLQGDPANNQGDANGAAYLFERQASGWRQRAYLKAPNPDKGDRFGQWLALSADGHSLAVGAWNESGGATGINGDQADNTARDSGAVYVY